MFDDTLQSLRTSVPRFIFSTLFDAGRLFKRMAQTAAGTSILMLGLLVLDGRILGDEQIWLKPFKFALSFSVYFATLASVTKRLSTLWRCNWIVALAATTSAIAFFFEMIYISAQAARQEPSHFNESTSFHEMMYGLMGVGATLLLGTVAVLGAVVWIDNCARMGPRLRQSILVGFLITVVLTFWIGGVLASNGGRFIGIVPPDSPRLPFLGWSMTVGDLRPAHFLALHAMQIVPILGIVADRYKFPEWFVWIASAIYVTFTVMVFLKALQGIPLISA